MKKEELKKIVLEEIQNELKEAYMDKDIPVVATILKSIMMTQSNPRGPLRRVSVYLKDGVLYLGEQIKKAQQLDIDSPEFKQLLSDKNISSVAAVLNSYLGMENMFVSDFVVSLKQMKSGQELKNTDDVSTVKPSTDQDTTKR